MDGIVSKLYDAATNLGDTALLAPLAASILLWMLMFHSWKAARAWGLAMAVAIVPIVLLKFALQTCDHTLVDLRIVTPSGHASFGLVVYGGLAMFIGREKGDQWRLTTWIAATLIVAGICITRLIMNIHSPAEVVIGLAVGGMALAVFRREIARAPVRDNLSFARAFLVFGAMGAAILGYMLYNDWGLPVDAVIRELAMAAGSNLLTCAPHSAEISPL
jgi:membrane-associated phospholipid phosphatase